MNKREMQSLRDEGERNGFAVAALAIEVTVDAATDLKAAMIDLAGRLKAASKPPRDEKEQG